MDKVKEMNIYYFEVKKLFDIKSICSNNKNPKNRITLHDFCFVFGEDLLLD